MQRLLAIALNQGATLIFGVIGIVLVSHIVAKPVYGAYTLFLTLTLIGPLLTHSGLANHASRYWQREQPAASPYARFLLRWSWLQGRLLAALLLAVSLGLWAVSRDRIWAGLWPLLLVSNFVTAFYAVASAVLNAGERHWALFTLTALSGAARSLLPVGLALLFSPTLLTLSFGFALHAVVVGAAVFFLFSEIRLSVPVDPSSESKWRRELREFGRPFVWMGVGGWLLQNADRWVVGAAFGGEQLGVFSMAANIATVIPNMVSAGLLQLVFPAVFREADRASTSEDWRRLGRRCDRFTLVFLGLTLAGLICLSLISPYLVPWLISAQYAASMKLLLPAGLAAAAMQVNQFQYLLLQGQHDSSSMVKVMMLLAAVRTTGSILAAAISWDVFLGWLTASTLLVSFLGRARIQGIAFRRAALAEPVGVSGSSGT